MKPKKIPWEIEPHTEVKHEILKRYLEPWMAILSKNHKQIIYIDGFAGPGEYLRPKQDPIQGLVDGSPIIAIKSFLEHKLKDKINEIRFLFIESNNKILKHLKMRLAPYKEKYPYIECINGEFDDVINQCLDSIETQEGNISPTFCFIDPFGIKGIPLETIKRIMDNKSCEVLINFMYEELNRFVQLPQNESHINALFGEDKEWKKIIALSNPGDRYNYLTGLYQKQLTNRCGIKHIKTFKMINKFNKEDYVLFFCTNHDLGLIKMKESMWKADESGTFSFSDATYNPSQTTLFGKTPDYETLKKMILDCYKSKTISINDLEDFVNFKTPFLVSHIRKPILDKMETNREIQVFSSKENRRKGTYPEGTQIKFN